MTHPAIPAVPKAGAPDRTLLQDMLVGRMAYWLGPSEDPEAFDPRSEDATTVVKLIFWQSKWYELDPDDSTTAHDGASCLVPTATGGRYKLIWDDLLFQFSVLSRTVEDPPDPEDEDEEDRPSYGDAYIVPSGASGDWSAWEDRIAIYTPRDWVSILPRKGRLVYVDDESGFVHWMGSAWVAGFGNQALSPDSVLPSELKGGGGKSHWIVENQTTNAPPGTVVEGVAYIVGPAPSGAWTGHTGKIAHGENGAWVLYTPAHGWRAFDKAIDGPFQYSGSEWLSSFGRLTLTRRVLTSSTTWTKPARLSYVVVSLLGGGGGARGGVGGTTNGSGGGSTSFGSHCSAGGGGGGNASPGNAGSDGSGGGQGLDGQPGRIGSRAAAGFSLGNRGRGGIGTGTETWGGGGGGGRIMVIQAADIGSNESVTVGNGGSGGGTGPQQGESGFAGVLVVEEYTFS